MNKVGIMQPYIFPYIGYFQMIKAVNVFVFYDDVNFIKGGWVNRNRILLNKKDAYLTIPCLSKSPNKKINEIEVNTNCKEFSNLLSTVKVAYKKAPHFETIYPLIEKILIVENITISELAMRSVELICSYLQIETKFAVSSLNFSNSFGFERSERLISICNTIGTQNYINAIGGMALYDKGYFKERGIQLDFIQCKGVSYPQFSNEFVPALSIIDVLMFNSVEDIQVMLNQYELV